MLVYQRVCEAPQKTSRSYWPLDKPWRWNLKSLQHKRCNFLYAFEGTSHRDFLVPLGASLQVPNFVSSQALLETLPIFQWEAPGIGARIGWWEDLRLKPPWRTRHFWVFRCSIRNESIQFWCFQSWFDFPCKAKMFPLVPSISTEDPSRNLSVNLYGKVKKAPETWDASFVVFSKHVPNSHWLRTMKIEVFEETP